MVSLVVVAFFLAMMASSYFGLIAGDWAKEKGVSYANPAFLAGAENLERLALAEDVVVQRLPVLVAALQDSRHERVEIPPEFVGVLKAAVRGAACVGCTHQHYLTAPKPNVVVAAAAALLVLGINALRHAPVLTVTVSRAMWQQGSETMFKISSPVIELVLSGQR